MNPYRNGRQTSIRYPEIDEYATSDDIEMNTRYNPGMPSLDSQNAPRIEPHSGRGFRSARNANNSIPYERFPEPEQLRPETDLAETHLVVPWDPHSVGRRVSDERSLLGYNSSSRSSFENQTVPLQNSTDSFQPDLERQGSRFRPRFWNQSQEGGEYADEEAVDYQIPIQGDEYQLNTWYEGDETQASPNLAAESLDDVRSVGYTDFGDAYNDDDDDDEEEKEEKDSDERGIRTVELFHGNLVLDCPVSSKLLEQYPHHSPAREFTHMRYSAATCDPSEFVNEQYTLRQMCYAVPRQTELFICVTIYNEDDILLARTLQGVFNNIRHLCHRDRSSTWGQEAWKKVVVCVVADGRNKLNPRTKALMTALGAYQEGFAKNMVNDKEVQAHIYEYTSMVRISQISESEGVKLSTEKAVPVQLLFCLKEKNQKKINSHRWFFQAFSELLQPKVCVLLDAGTRPGNHSIYHLWKSFAKDEQVAGACGEIAAMLGPFGYKLYNPLVAAQNFEYKMSNILDKPSESVFGFISVLPGAFSAYRFSALMNHADGTGPLEKYFKGEKLEGTGGVFQANMYLAEDRILCWELVSKRGSNWVLRYVKQAKAHTDVPERLSELILQRRRWLNGSFFATIYALAHFFSIWRSGHSIPRILALHIQFIYSLLTLIFSWFSLASFFLIFHILSAALGDSSVNFAPGKILGVVLSWIYCACLLVVFIMSFGNRPQGTRKLYDTIVVFFALMMGYMIFATVFISVKAVQYAICANTNFQFKLLFTNSTFRDLIISLLATYILYFISSLLFLDPWHVFTSMFQYVLISPTYVNVMNVYAFCNTHDISWGTKGDTVQKLDLGAVKANESGTLELELPTSSDLVDKYYLEELEVLSEPPEKSSAPNIPDSEKQRDFYALFRSAVVIVWVLMNLALVGVVLNIGGFQSLIGLSNNSTVIPTKRDLYAEVLVRASTSTCQEISTGGNEVSKVYMAVIFWSVAGMGAYRFILCIIFLITGLIR